MVKQVNVLFTSAGRRVELLRAFRRAYDTLGLAGNVVALDINPLAPALQLTDRTYIVPRLSSPDYVPALTGICERERPALIFPLTDPDIPVLAKHRRPLAAAGALLAVVEEGAAAIAGDKWSTYEFFTGIGLDAPKSWLPDQLESGSLEYPVFIKPRGGSAGSGAYKVRNAHELAFFVDYLPDPIIQEFLPGPEITNDVICDTDGTVLAVVSRLRMEVRGGEVTKGVTIYDEAITRACIRVAEALPAIGPITVQCMMREGKPYFTEINARLGGGIPLGIAAGVNSPRLLLARAAGLPIEVPPIGSYRTGVYMTRFDDSFFLDQGELDQVSSRRL